MLRARSDRFALPRRITGGNSCSCTNMRVGARARARALSLDVGPRQLHAERRNATRGERSSSVAKRGWGGEKERKLGRLFPWRSLCAGARSNYRALARQLTLS
jgi:hypothetical protein